jgi:hypothetical protein
MVVRPEDCIPAKARDRWIVAADLGQSNDPTAIAALHHTIVPLDTWDEPNARCSQWKQQRVERFYVRYLERLPLGMSYLTQVGRVAEVLKRPWLAADYKFLVDETGVGRTVADLFDGAGLRPTRITITAGHEVTQSCGDYHVPKSVLISTVDARLHSGELRVAEECREAETLRNELKDFQSKRTSSGYVSFNARDGAHDDLVLAVSMALWWATQGTQSGSVAHNLW